MTNCSAITRLSISPVQSILESTAPEIWGKYGTYVDLVPGEWTKMKSEVKGDKARLYVNHAPDPHLSLTVFCMAALRARSPCSSVWGP